METPEQRTQRIRANDAYKREYEHANTALYFSSITLKNSPNRLNLQNFLNAVDFQAKVFAQYLKTYDNLQLRLRVIYKLENVLDSNQTNYGFRTACMAALTIAHCKARQACEEFGNITPFYRPLNRVKDGAESDLQATK